MKNLFGLPIILLLFATSVSVRAQVPVLNSYPSAAAVMFLDFDGQTVNGTIWNGNGPIYCGGSGLNAAAIGIIFDRVSEDYRPFNINVTTDSTKFLAAPISQRMRVIITVSSDWYGSAGGVSFVGSFTWGDDTPCFIFSQLLNYNVKNISEAVAHEAGHTLGLYHQSTYDASCNKTSDYSYGQGTGEIGWAPIMGVGYYQNFTLWNNGPNSFGCTNLQSDLDIITTYNGFTYRNDDYGNTTATAVSVPFAGNQFTIGGVIEKSTDKDFIKFIQPANGRFQLDAAPYSVGTGNAGSDLDMQVTLFNGAGGQLNMYNPGTLLNSVIDTQLNAGTYYLRVEGRGNVYAPNYASLGSYALKGQFTANSNPLPLRRLELHGALDGARHQLSWIIDADEQVVQQTLEVSTDGRNFTTLTQSPVNARAYTYTPSITSGVQYRLNVTFDNGRQYYSNIITLRQSGTAPRPQLVSNLISTDAVNITSPGNYDYAIYDFNGKTVIKGALTNGFNTINIPHITAGMYLVRFSKGTDQWMEKLVRQ